MEEELDINEALGLGEAEVITEPEAKEQVDEPEFSEVEQAAIDKGSIIWMGTASDLLFFSDDIFGTL